ncbi:MAG: RdgB/HAM1 family non-canonical purine NTP pyrophosphatase [Rhodobacterales bacterium]|nr:RdgB/HAM1 family non-canonical purine NTP pyrophosphatase [Rhodobacterales bacterium]
MDARPATPRRFDGDRLVIATHNAGKLREIDDLLAPFGVTVVSAGELGLPEPVEDGLTFAANAEIKARAAAEASGLPALADDSGLAVHALGGQPGIYSARWAGTGKDFGLAMEKVHTALGDATDRSAHFACALTLAWPGPAGRDGDLETFEGTVHGTLVWPPRGDRGFGYDPMFVPDGHAVTFGEMNPADKHAMSHRADAFRKLVAACFAPATVR